MNPGAATASHLHGSATGWSPALVGPDGERALHWALRLADELRWVEDRCVPTGTFCSYVPETGTPLAWSAVVA